MTPRRFAAVVTLLPLLALGAGAGEDAERLWVAVAPRRAENWRTAGLARAVRRALCRVPQVHATNASVTRRLVPTGAEASLTDLSEAGRRLRARFVVLVDAPEAQEATADVVRVGDAEGGTRPQRRRVTATAPVHQLPGELAVRVADAMSLRLDLAERQRVRDPDVADDGACEALWRGQAEADLVRRQALFAQAAERAPTSALVHNRLGTVFARLDQPESAIAAFGRATRLRPDYAAAYTNCGQVLAQQKRWREAEAVFRRAIALGPKSATPHIGLARLLDRVGATLAAVEQLERAVDVDPCHLNALLTLSEFYFEQHDLRSATRLTQRILELDPHHVPALNTRALLFLAGRSPLRAEGALRAAIQIAPESAISHANLGLVLFAQKRPTEAIAALQEAIALDPTDGKPHFYLGRVYLEREEYQKAVDEFQRAVELSPRLAAARDGLRQARAAKLRGDQGCGGCGAAPRLSQAGGPAGPLALAALLLGPHAARLARRRRRP